MAINGADAIRPIGPELRVTRVRPAGSHDSPKREQETSARATEPEARPPRAAPRRIELPEFAGRDLSFRHDEELNRVIVEVVDAETREVVRTIPPEEVVNVLKSIRKAQGALLDEEA